MAGSNPGFSGSEFRSAIRFVYDMAAPPITEEQATFYGQSTLVYTGGPLDDEDVPFDPNTTVVRQAATGIKVPCGVEYFDTEGQPVPFGMVTATRVAVTLLDEDYRKVRDATYVVIGGEKYLYRRTQPPKGLFDVGLYVMHFTAENEI